MTKTAGSRSASGSGFIRPKHGSGSGSIPKCHGSGTLVKILTQDSKPLAKNVLRVAFTFALIRYDTTVSLSV
jgi:hypothetical protein